MRYEKECSRRQSGVLPWQYKEDSDSEDDFEDCAYLDEDGENIPQKLISGVNNEEVVQQPCVFSIHWTCTDDRTLMIIIERRKREFRSMSLETFRDLLP